jgi:methylglutaconyl-CoA hydratase
MANSTLILELEPDLATITLNRPEKRNALSPQLIQDLLEALDIVSRSSAGVAILTGAGKSFCAGMDLDVLAGLSQQPRELHLEDSRRMATMFRALYDFPKPLIAAVQGPAIAGGCGIATLCDFTLAAPEAKFGYTEVRIGFLPAIVSVFLIRQIGEKRARDLLLTGRVFGADEAFSLGLVNEIVPAESLLERARQLAHALLAVSPTSLRRTKRLLRSFSEADLNRELELAIQANAEIRSTVDFREGLAAFLEKRAPNWHGE